jgi:Galactose oxidase, central domain
MKSSSQIMKIPFLLRLAGRLPLRAAFILGGGIISIRGLLSSAAVVSLAVTAVAGGTWTYTGSLNTARRDHTATLLDPNVAPGANGKVLVAGGDGFSFGNLASAELYDPASGTWTATGSLNTGRDYHTATLLQNGKVLVAGGVPPAQNFTIRRRGPGLSPAASTTSANFTRRHCCPMARCWWLGGHMVAAI